MINDHILACFLLVIYCLPHFEDDAPSNAYGWTQDLRTRKRNSTRHSRLGGSVFSEHGRVSERSSEGFAGPFGVPAHAGPAVPPIW